MPLRKIKKPSSQLKYIGEHFDGFHKNGDGFKACCPAHDDSDPSLSLNLGRDGNVLMHCHAGCRTQDILEIVGLGMADLKSGAKPRGLITATYNYMDTEGNLVYQSCRKEFPDGSKEFPVRQPDGHGGWLWNLHGVERIPYRLQDLMNADPNKPVFIVEGEKDANRLVSLRLTATCNIGGAGKWKPLYNQYFAGKDVVILLDNDDAGRRHGDDVAENLSGIAKSIKIIDLPGLPKKGDISDWLDGGKTKKNLMDIVRKTPIKVIKIIVSGVPGENVNKVIKIIKPPPLGEAVFLGLAGEFLRAVDSYTEATPACILAHLLPAVGVIIGPKPFTFAGGRQPCRINSVLVGQTNSGRKGTGFTVIDELMKRVDKDFWEQQRVGGLSSGEGLIARVADRRKKNDDDESEPDEVEKRLFVIEPEFSRVLGNIARGDSNILSQVIREAYDSGNLSTLTVKLRRAVGAHICIVGHITPTELLLKLKNVEMCNGFANRFLWFFVMSEKILAQTEPIPEPIFMKFAPLLRSLVSLKEKHFGLTKGAMKLWEQIYPSLREDRNGMAGEMVSRGSTMVLRLALIYALLDKKRKVGTEHLEAGLAVWRYSELSVEALFRGQMGETLTDKVLLLLGNGSMTKTDFNKHLSVKQKYEIDNVLVTLEASEQIRGIKVKHKGAGRPAIRYELIG